MDAGHPEGHGEHHGVFGHPDVLGGHDPLGGVGNNGGHGPGQGHGHPIGHNGPPGIHSPIGHDANMSDGKGRLIDRGPLTWLPLGITHGWYYGKETYIHARTFGHRTGVDKCVPKGTALTANMAQVIALEAARKHGANELSFYQQGYLFNHPSFIGRVNSADASDPGRRVNMPGIARNLNTVEVLVWPHGQCSPEKELRRVMKGLNCIRLDLRQTSSLPDIEKMEYKLLSANPFASSQDALNQPNGWFRRNREVPAKGRTFLWREFYQLDRSIWDVIRNPDDRDMHGTFLAVFGATWYYEETGDYETRIAFSVYGLPYVSSNHETFKWQRLSGHRFVAEDAAAAMFRYISGVRPPSESLRRRIKLRPELTEPVAPAPRDPFEPTAPVVVSPVPPPLDPPGPEADEAKPTKKKEDDEDDK